MSICDNCIHDEVCGIECNHEEAMTFCANMIPKLLENIRSEIYDNLCTVTNPNNTYESISVIDIEKLDEIFDKYIGKSEVEE